MFICVNVDVEATGSEDVAEDDEDAAADNE